MSTSLGGVLQKAINPVAMLALVAGASNQFGAAAAPFPRHSPRSLQMTGTPSPTESVGAGEIIAWVCSVASSTCCVDYIECLDFGGTECLADYNTCDGESTSSSETTSLGLVEQSTPAPTDTTTTEAPKTADSAPTGTGAPVDSEASLKTPSPIPGGDIPTQGPTGNPAPETDDQVTVTNGAGRLGAANNVFAAVTVVAGVLATAAASVV